MKSNAPNKNPRRRQTACLSCGDLATLGCGKCGDPFCGKCIFHTPGGIRCQSCAQLRKPIQYQISGPRLIITISTLLSASLILGVLSIIPTALIAQIPLLNIVGHALIGYLLALVLSKLLEVISGNKLGRPLQITGLISGLFVVTGRTIIILTLTGGVILGLSELLMTGVICIITWRRFE